MKNLMFAAVFCLALTALFPLAVHSQQSSPMWVMLFEEHVSPADRSGFMKVQQEAVGLWKKHNLDIMVLAYENDDNDFYWVVPIRNFASIDTLYSKMAVMSEKMKADGYNGAEKFKDLSTISSSVLVYAPELSHRPGRESGQSVEYPYTEWMHCYLRSGHEKEAADAIKKYVGFYEENGEDYSWDTYRVLLGNETPALVMKVSTTNPADLRTREAELMDKYGSDFSMMWNDFAKHLRKTEIKTGWFMPEFSNFPGQ